MQVEYEPAVDGWVLQWKDLMLRFRIHDGVALTDYFGPIRDHETPSLPGPEIFDPLTVSNADTAVQFAPDDRQVSWSAGEGTCPDPASFEVILQAKDRPLRAILRFTVDEETGILLRRTLLQHTGDGPALDLSHAGSATAVLPPDVLEVVHLSGRWGAETQVQRVLLSQTALLLESRSGKSGFEFSPYLALLAPSHTYFTQLLWSGNWRYYVRRQFTGRVVLAGGLNPWGFRHRLAPGDSLALPDMLLGCVAGDLNEATQQLHHFLRSRHRPSDGDRTVGPGHTGGHDPASSSGLVPVQFNSWFPFQGEPPVETMKAYATRAAALGCEVFVLDAGWYTTEHENPDEGWWLRTGDWVVDRKLFPAGLEELSAHCRQVGIDFGIWVEPEAVGPSAAIRQSHPEWLHAVGGRTTPPEERAILNLGVPQARAWIRERILAIVRSTGARWLKWDFNTDLRQGGWSPAALRALPGALTRQDPLVAHYRGLYLLQEELREACPVMTLEMCSSGGGRFDEGIMERAHAYWISDQTHPLMKLAIHLGSQLAHPPEQCNDWLVEWPPHEAQHDDLRCPGGEHGDLRFRLAVAMLGSFGISAPVERWSDEDFAVVKEHVFWYKRFVRPTLPVSRQYLLTGAPPLDGNGEWAAVWYGLPEGAGGVLFAFRLANGLPRRTFALAGLDEEAVYHLASVGGWSTNRTGKELTAGIEVQATEAFRAVLLFVEKVGT